MIRILDIMVRWAWIVLCLPLLFSCYPYYRHAPMETTIKDSLYITQRMIDRVLVRDSVFERHTHDTIYRYRERETIRYLSLRDTMYIERRDSVSVHIPVERELSKWQQARMRLGDISVAAMIVGIIYVVLWLIKLRSR